MIEDWASHSPYELLGRDDLDSDALFGLLDHLFPMVSSDECPSSHPAPHTEYALLLDDVYSRSLLVAHAAALLLAQLTPDQLPAVFLPRQKTALVLAWATLLDGASSCPRALLDRVATAVMQVLEADYDGYDWVPLATAILGLDAPPRPWQTVLAALHTDTLAAALQRFSKPRRAVRRLCHVAFVLGCEKKCLPVALLDAVFLFVTAPQNAASQFGYARSCLEATLEALVTGGHCDAETVLQWHQAHPSSSSSSSISTATSVANGEKSCPLGFLLSESCPRCDAPFPAGLDEAATLVLVHGYYVRGADVHRMYKNAKRVWKRLAPHLAPFSRLTYFDSLRLRYPLRRHLVPELDACDACLALGHLFHKYGLPQLELFYLDKLHALHRDADRPEAAYSGTLLGHSRQMYAGGLKAGTTTPLKLVSSSSSSSGVPLHSTESESSPSTPSPRTPRALARDASLRALRGASLLAQAHKAQGDHVAASLSLRIASSEAAPQSDFVFALVLFWGAGSALMHVHRVWDGLDMEAFTRILVDSYSGARRATREEVAQVMANGSVPDALRAAANDGFVVGVLPLEPQSRGAGVDVDEFLVPLYPRVSVRVRSVVPGYDRPMMPDLTLRKPAVLVAGNLHLQRALQP